MAPGQRPFAVTVNWNRAEDTVECVRSILNGNPEVEVLVVDNGSRDGSVPLLLKNFPGLKVVENEENMGYAKGVNRGIKRALEEGATHILVVNNDAIVRPGMVVDLLEALERHPHAGIVGPKIFYYGTDVMWFNGGHFNHWLGLSTHPLMDWKDDGGDQDRQVSFITGCAMLVKAEIFSDIGQFDEDFEIYAEDLEFCLRAEEKGYESWLVPRAIAEHKVSISTGVAGSNLMTPYRAYFYGRNMLMLVQKRKSGLSLLTCFFGQTLILIPYYFMIIAIQGARRSFRRYVKGYIHALMRMVSGAG
ncbi:MAG TPA: glycosyltransferase family 2 protein [Methanomassiliicoccales archaeon]|nr:glycosyltransferase family 2 protein [Methanomassiliicoccales archaeon]